MSTSATHPEGAAARQIGRSWVLRSKARVRLFGAAAGLLITGTATLAEWFFYTGGESPLVLMFASNVFAGLLVMLIIAGVLERIVDRAEAVRARLQMIADLNHHVRNALQVIAYTAHSTRDQEAIAKIDDAAERIDWALREVLGTGFSPPAETQPKNPS